MVSPRRPGGRFPGRREGRWPASAGPPLGSVPDTGRPVWRSFFSEREATHVDSTISAAGHAAPHAIDDDRKVRLGMLFYVLTDVILVTFLFAAYVWLRAYNTNGGWFPYQ